MFYSGKVEKIQLVISDVLLAVLVISIFSSVYTQNWTVLFVSGLALILIFLPTMAGKRLGVRLPTEFKFTFLLFIYGALFLGDIHGYYEMFWWWDLVLHFFSAVGLGVIGFMLVFMLASRQKIRTSYLLLAIFSFSFALAFGVIWEIFEFIVDNLFDANMQRSGLNDTMGDLIMDTVGALAASASGYLYIKFNKAPVLRGMINKFFIKI